MFSCRTLNCFLLSISCLGVTACGPRLKTPALVSFEQQRLDQSKVQKLQTQCPDLMNEAFKYYNKALEAHNDNEAELSSYFIKLAQISWQTSERRAQYLEHRSKMTIVKTRLNQAQKLLNLALQRKQELKDMQVKQADLIRKEASAREQNRKQAEQAQGQQVKIALDQARIARQAALKVVAPEFAKGLYNKGEMALKSAEAAIQRGDFINAERIAVGANEDFKAAETAALPMYEKDQRKLALKKKMDELLRDASSITGGSAVMESRGVVLTVSGLYRRGKQSPRAPKILGDLVNLVSKYKTFRLIIEGHTTSHGSRKKKLAKTESMANEVMNYVKAQVGNDLKVGALGRGDYAPFVANTKSPQNERVDIVFFKPRLK
ncbi:MAG: hypothetical protein CMH49_05390 [Myxococcales bacterium]|nr:hypothetical protein [Myxococcales bacterium]